MPTYVYACSKCGQEFEVFQSMKDSALTTCPKDKCPRPRWGKGKVQRQLGTGAGLIFKGSGFYITDYRSENYKAAAKKDAPSTSSSDAKPSTPASSSGSAAASGSAAPAPKSTAPPKPKAGTS